MKNNFKTHQAGRSLIEMLAVLAIIGIISVTALLGFSSAMNKHYANETMEEINQRLQIYLPQFDKGFTKFSHDSLGTTTYYNYSVEAGIDNNHKLFISLQYVPIVICKKLLPLATDFKVSVAGEDFSNGNNPCDMNPSAEGIAGIIKFVYDK